MSVGGFIYEPRSYLFAIFSYPRYNSSCLVRKFFLSAQRKFVTNFVTLVTKFLIHVSKFVIRVTKFVIKITYRKEKFCTQKGKISAVIVKIIFRIVATLCHERRKVHRLSNT